VADGTEFALGGKVVFVSRSREEARELCDALESSGGSVIAASLLRFALPEDPVTMDATLKSLRKFDWWLITSRRAVEFAAARRRAIGDPLAEIVKGVRVGVVGTATAKAARAAGIAVAYVARQQSAVGLAEELAEKVAGKRVLLLRSNLADSALPASLAKSGAEVTDVIAYRTLPPDEEEKRRLASIAWENVNATVFFSPSAIRHLANAIGTEKMRKAARRALCVAVGPTTADAARQLGFERCVQAEEPSAAAVVSALEESFANRRSRKVMGVRQR
jgi:uroporphyrinogen-III synthase